MCAQFEMHPKSQIFLIFPKFLVIVQSNFNTYFIMTRKFFNQLVAWKNQKERMPFIVNGARQIGKTFSITEFGEKEFDNTVYINTASNSFFISFLRLIFICF